MYKAAILTIGDELLNGLVLDRNASYLARRLSELGFEVEEVRSVSDRSGPIQEALRNWEGEFDIVLMTGGLGPTDDDRTKAVLADYLGVGFERNEEIEKDVREYLVKRGREVGDRDLAQADMPEGSQIFRNPHGSAPAIRVESKGTRIIAMPGVPHEMRVLVEEQLVPYLMNELGREPITQRTLVTSGLGESDLVERIEDIVQELEKEGVEFAYLSSPGMVRIRMMDMSDRGSEGEASLDRGVNALKDRIPEFVVGVGNKSFPAFIGEGLEDKGLSVACAESCTGGYIGHMLSSVAGSSSYFNGGVIAYSNSVKKALLEVPQEMLDEHGAVSGPVVERMAMSVRNCIGSDLGVATSGIMGPSGGSEEKPIGTTWMAVSDGKDTMSEKWTFGDQRGVNIERAARAALNLLRKKVELL